MSVATPLAIAPVRSVVAMRIRRWRRPCPSCTRLSWSSRSVGIPRAEAAATKQIKAVRDKFSPQNAAAAGEILLGFVEACKLDHPQRNVQLNFARDGTFGWLLSLVKEDLVPSDDEPMVAKPVKK